MRSPPRPEKFKDILANISWKHAKVLSIIQKLMEDIAPIWSTFSFQLKIRSEYGVSGAEHSDPGEFLRSFPNNFLAILIFSSKCWAGTPIHAKNPISGV